MEQQGIRFQKALAFIEVIPKEMENAVQWVREHKNLAQYLCQGDPIMWTEFQKEVQTAANTGDSLYYVLLVLRQELTRN